MALCKFCSKELSFALTCGLAHMRTVLATSVIWLMDRA